MYNPIEIQDSDDEMAEPSSRVKPTVTSGSEASEPTPEKKRKVSMSAAKSTDVLMVKSRESLSSDTTSSPTSSSSANQTKPQVRHRARKTQHTVRNAAENEIQFESILLDNDTKEKEAYSTAAAQEQKELRLPSESDPIKNTVNQFLGSDEVQQIIQRIANERVRCNFLLATYKVRLFSGCLSICLIYMYVHIFFLYCSCQI